MLNTIEYSFSKSKSSVRSLLSNGYNCDFTEVIHIGVNSLTFGELTRYFRHMRTNCAKAAYLQDVI